MKNKCVVILSGGPDSTTVAYWAKKQGYKVHAITFNYGQIAITHTNYGAMQVPYLKSVFICFGYFLYDIFTINK